MGTPKSFNERSRRAGLRWHRAERDREVVVPLWQQEGEQTERARRSGFSTGNGSMGHTGSRYMTNFRDHTAPTWYCSDIVAVRQPARATKHRHLRLRALIRR